MVNFFCRGNLLGGVVFFHQEAYDMGVSPSFIIFILG